MLRFFFGRFLCSPFQVHSLPFLFGNLLLFFDSRESLEVVFFSSRFFLRSGFFSPLTQMSQVSFFFPFRRQLANKKTFPRSPPVDLDLAVSRSTWRRESFSP